MSKGTLEIIGLLTVAALAPGLLQAGETQLGGQQGTDDPPLCGQNCDVELELHPEVVCVDRTDIDDLLNCMLAVELREAWNFESWLLEGTSHGTAFRREHPIFPGYTIEIERLEIYESQAGIATTQLTVDRGDRVARIGEIAEVPDNDGAIIIELDDDIVEFEDPGDPPDTTVWVGVFDTSTNLTALDLNIAISQWLRSIPDSEVQYDAGYFVVTKPGGFRRVQFRSTDGGVIVSDIALLPENDPEIEHLFMPE